MGELIVFAIIVFVCYAVNKTWRQILRIWRRKKFCDSNRGLCRALINAGFPDFKEYLYFKGDIVTMYVNWYACIYFRKSEMSIQDKERILEVVKKYHTCFTEDDKESGIIRIYFNEDKYTEPAEDALYEQLRDESW